MKYRMNVPGEEQFVRFTPDGKIVIVDAIASLTSFHDPADLWERIRTEHPETAEMCEDYAFTGENLSVIDGEGWEQIIELLPEYLFGL